MKNGVNKYRGGGDELRRSRDRGLLPDVLRSNILVRYSNHGRHHRRGGLRSGGRGDGVRGDKHSDLVGGNGAGSGRNLND